MEEKLKREAKKKFGSTTSKRAREYIYGTLRKHGWKPEREKTKKHHKKKHSKKRS